MTPSRGSRPRRAAEAWRLMFDFLMQSAPQRLESLQRHSLTPNDARVLFALDIEGKAIGMLARELACDPSNATWMVDRLEGAGLAERRSSERDRRVKLVGLTPKGATTRKELLEEHHRPPPQFAGLSAKELDELTGLLKRLHSLEQPKTQKGEPSASAT